MGRDCAVMRIIFLYYQIDISSSIVIEEKNGKFQLLDRFHNCEGAIIDWTKKIVQETAGEANYHMNCDYQEENYPVLDSYEKLACALSDTKLYGYFSPEKINVLQTISKYSSLPPSGSHPTMFFEYEAIQIHLYYPYGLLVQITFKIQ